MCAAMLGMTPAQVDECSFRDLNAMLAGAAKVQRQREEEAWKRSLTVAQACMNIMARKPRPLNTLWKNLTNKAALPEMSLEEYREWRDAAVEKLMARYVNANDSEC